MQDKLRNTKKSKPGQKKLTYKCLNCGEQMCGICDGRGCIECNYVDHHEDVCSQMIDQGADDAFLYWSNNVLP